MNLLGLVSIPIVLDNIIFTLVTLAIALTHPHVDKIMIVFLQVQNNFQVRRADKRVLILGKLIKLWDFICQIEHPRPKRDHKHHVDTRSVFVLVVSSYCGEGKADETADDARQQPTGEVLEIQC